MPITITNQIDKNTIEEYGFTIMDSNIIYLNTYRIATKEPRQRYARTVKRYDRLNSRDSTIKEEDVPFTPEIREEAIRIFSTQLKCLKWSERGQK